MKSFDEPVPPLLSDLALRIWAISTHKSCYGWIAPTDLIDICICKQEYSQRIPSFFYRVLVFQSGYECNTELSYESPVYFLYESSVKIRCESPIKIDTKAL